MIAQLRGEIVEAKIKDGLGQLILDVQGVGYQIFVPLPLVYQYEGVQTPVTLAIHTHVREDSLVLFGFPNSYEKEVFELLISVSGIGPRVGVGIFSATQPNDFLKLVQNQDLPGLKKLPGIGKKTAERLLLELSEKVAKLGLQSKINLRTPQVRSNIKDAIDALRGLGYKESIAEGVLQRVNQKNPAGELTVSALVKEGLKELGQSLNG